MLSWLEINLDNIAQNIKSIRSFISGRSKIMAMIKANAYGHGLIEVGKCCQDAGADFLGVDEVREALALRFAGVRIPILVMGFTEREDVISAIKNNISLTVSNIYQGRLISEEAEKIQRKAKVHLKVDTGMRRFGPIEVNAVEFLKEVKKIPKLEFEGLYSHLASAEARDKSFTFRQLGTFQEIIADFKKEGFSVPYNHIAASAAALSIPSSQLDMVRLGIVIYGLFPTPELRSFFDLKPAMVYKAKIVELKKLPGSQKIGYGGAYTTQNPTTIAVMPIGYADGIDRGLSNLGKVLVRGQRVSIIGRVCMNSTIIDVTDVDNVAMEDEIVVIGRQGNEEITPGELAGYTGTINYEIIARIPEHITRVYIKEGKKFTNSTARKILDIKEPDKIEEKEE
jgi:alanine racemase